MCPPACFSDSINDEGTGGGKVPFQENPYLPIPFNPILNRPCSQFYAKTLSSISIDPRRIGKYLTLGL
jgi:hypothetical protein